jgi:hypothetical protein
MDEVARTRYLYLSEDIPAIPGRNKSDHEIP